MGFKHHPSLYRFWLRLYVVISISSMIAEPLKAQVFTLGQAVDGNSLPPRLPPPQDVQPPPLPPPLPSSEPPLLPPPEELLQPAAPSAPQEIPSPSTTSPEVSPGQVPKTIVVREFEVVGSTVFSSKEFAQITLAFTNRPISFAELFQVRFAVTQLYVDRGYITSGAYIPPQTLQGGIVKIQVIEGGLESIKITGTKRLNPNYVRSRLAIATERPLNQNRLLEALQLLQLNPLIKNLSAELSAGARPGTSLLEVRITEAQSFSAQIVLDNGRVPSVGSFRRRLQLNEGNLLGQGDGLSLAYTNTTGSNALDASYSLPFNPRNGTFSLNYGTTWSHIIEEPFDILNINANSRYYELTLRQPVIQTPTREFSLGLTASRRESEISFLEGVDSPNSPAVPFPSPGAEDGRTKISALRFFQEWTQRSIREVIAARSQFNLGIGAFDATVNGSPPDSRFFAWQGQAQWVRLLAQDTLLLVRANLQLADRALLPLEQFSLGGLESLRGYRQDLLLTDNGAFASAEVRLPILRVSQLDGVLQVAPFLDLGTAWNSSGRGNPNPNTLASIGLGLRWQQGDRLTVRLDWGIPLVTFDADDSTWRQENGLFFSVLYNPF